MNNLFVEISNIFVQSSLGGYQYIDSLANLETSTHYEGWGYPVSCRDNTVKKLEELKKQIYKIPHDCVKLELKKNAFENIDRLVERLTPSPFAENNIFSIRDLANKILGYCSSGEDTVRLFSKTCKDAEKVCLEFDPNCRSNKILLDKLDTFPERFYSIEHNLKVLCLRYFKMHLPYLFDKHFKRNEFCIDEFNSFLNDLYNTRKNYGIVQNEVNMIGYLFRAEKGEVVKPQISQSTGLLMRILYVFLESNTDKRDEVVISLKWMNFKGRTNAKEVLNRDIGTREVGLFSRIVYVHQSLSNGKYERIWDELNQRNNSNKMYLDKIYGLWAELLMKDNKIPKVIECAELAFSHGNMSLNIRNIYARALLINILDFEQSPDWAKVRRYVDEVLSVYPINVEALVTKGVTISFPDKLQPIQKILIELGHQDEAFFVSFFHLVGTNKCTRDFLIKYYEKIKLQPFDLLKYVFFNHVFFLNEIKDLSFECSQKILEYAPDSILPRAIILGKESVNALKKPNFNNILSDFKRLSEGRHDALVAENIIQAGLNLDQYEVLIEYLNRNLNETNPFHLESFVRILSKKERYLEALIIAKKYYLKVQNRQSLYCLLRVEAENQHWHEVIKYDSSPLNTPVSKSFLARAKVELNHSDAVEAASEVLKENPNFYSKQTYALAHLKNGNLSYAKKFIGENYPNLLNHDQFQLHSYKYTRKTFAASNLFMAALLSLQEGQTEHAYRISHLLLSVYPSVVEYQKLALLACVSCKKVTRYLPLNLEDSLSHDFELKIILAYINSTKDKPFPVFRPEDIPKHNLLYKVLQLKDKNVRNVNGLDSHLNFIKYISETFQPVCQENWSVSNFYVLHYLMQEHVVDPVCWELLFKHRFNEAEEIWDKYQPRHSEYRLMIKLLDRDFKGFETDKEHLLKEHSKTIKPLLMGAYYFLTGFKDKAVEFLVESKTADMKNELIAIEGLVEGYNEYVQMKAEKPSIKKIKTEGED